MPLASHLLLAGLVRNDHIYARKLKKASDAIAQFVSPTMAARRQPRYRSSTDSSDEDAFDVMLRRTRNVTLRAHQPRLATPFAPQDQRTGGGTSTPKRRTRSADPGHGPTKPVRAPRPKPLRKRRSRSAQTENGRYDLRMTKSRIAISSANSSHHHSTQHHSSQEHSSHHSSHHSSSHHSSQHSLDMSVVMLEHMLPGKRIAKSKTCALRRGNLKSFCVDRRRKPLQLEPGKWRRSLQKWKVSNGADLRPPGSTDQSTTMQHIGYRRSMHVPNLLSSTNDVKFSVFAQELSSRLQSALTFDESLQPPPPPPAEHADRSAAFADDNVDQADREVDQNDAQSLQQQQQRRPPLGVDATDATDAVDLGAADNQQQQQQQQRRRALLLEQQQQQQQHRAARVAVLRECRQTEPLPFGVAYPDVELRSCRKIGEGVFGEVFMRKLNGRASVLKIIPIEGAAEVNGEPQKRFAEVLSELVITGQLSALRNGRTNATTGFVELLAARCVRGAYPERLVELWELYKENRGTDNDSPAAFGADQLFVVLELANGGEDLEAFVFDSDEQKLAVFKQIAVTLAVAEEALRFEHRDLHWGNILLARTSEPHIGAQLFGNPIRIATHGVRVTIIDYTLSRIELDGTVLYNDLATDEDLFRAGGDYQFDVYRLMRSFVNNVWRDHKPFTNVMWLHYVSDKLLKDVHCSAELKQRQRQQQQRKKTGGGGGGGGGGRSAGELQLIVLRDRLLVEEFSCASLVYQPYFWGAEVPGSYSSGAGSSGSGSGSSSSGEESDD